MNVALISDLHFGKNKDILLDNQLDFMKNDFVNYLKENNISTIFILGDIFDTRQSLNVMVKNEVYNLFDTYLKDFEMYILVGNHDSYFNTSIDVNSLKFFNKFPNIHLIEEPTLISLNEKNIYLVPWIVNHSKFIDDFQKVNCDLVFGHFDIAGCKMNKSVVSQNGLDKNIFSKSKKVFSGHFHTRSSVNLSKTEITYLGSPFQFDRGDIGEDRGFIDLDLNSLQYEYVNNENCIKFNKVNISEVDVENLNVKNNIIDIYINKSSNFTDKQIEGLLEKINKKHPTKIANFYFIDDEVKEDNKEFNLSNENVSDLNTLIKEYIDTLNNFTDDNKLNVYNYMLDLKNEIEK